MNNEIDVIEKRIRKLESSIIERYNESIKNIDKNISGAKDAALDAVVNNRSFNKRAR
jgi:hypothetical protein